MRTQVPARRAGRRRRRATAAMASPSCDEFHLSLLALGSSGSAIQVWPFVERIHIRAKVESFVVLRCMLRRILPHCRAEMDGEHRRGSGRRPTNSANIGPSSTSKQAAESPCCPGSSMRFLLAVPSRLGADQYIPDWRLAGILVGAGPLYWLGIVTLRPPRRSVAVLLGRRVSWNKRGAPHVTAHGKKIGTTIADHVGFVGPNRLPRLIGSHHQAAAGVAAFGSTLLTQPFATRDALMRHQWGNWCCLLLVSEVHPLQTIGRRGIFTPTVVFQEFSNGERCKTAKSSLETSLKEAGAKLRAGLEDLKKVDAADPKQVIIAYNVECLRR